MGQYYNTVLFNDDSDCAVLRPIDVKCGYKDWKCGWKLMEHAWIGNRYANKVVARINANSGIRVAHIGDYAERITTDMGRFEYYRVAWDEDYEGYAPAHKKGAEMPSKHVRKTAYIRNLDKNEYIRYEPKYKGEDEINPLMLLIAVGCEGAGGDYRGEDVGVVGRWAFDRLSVTYKNPSEWNDNRYLNSCVEICPHFKGAY